jgi:hypothetical protein
MRKLVYLSALCVSVVLPAVSQTVVKGHHLGETVQEFLQADPNIQAQLASCHASEPKPITVEQARKMPDHKQAEKLAEQGKLFTADTRTTEELYYCYHLVGALENRQPVCTPVTQNACNIMVGAWEGAHEKAESLTFTPGPDVGDPRWSFTDGRLSSIYVEFHPGTFAEVETDLTKRIGIKPDEAAPAYSNAYGATWNNQVAVWLSPELFASLTENRNPTEQSLVLRMTTRSSYDAQAKAKQSAKSPLD